MGGCSLYARSTSATDRDLLIDAYLKTGELHVSGFLDRLRAHVVGAAKFADLENAQNLFMNINTREDLAEAIRILEQVIRVMKKALEALRV